MAKNISLQPNQRLLFIILGVAVLLCVPLIAMQFTSEVNWDVMDFVVAGVLLLGAGIMCELVLRKFKTFKSRLLVCALIFFALVLIWAELAVGIFGSPLAGS